MAGLHLGVVDIVSPAFEHGGPIPDRHPTEGEDTSPPLSWTDVPAECRSSATTPTRRSRSAPTSAPTGGPAELCVSGR